MRADIHVALNYGQSTGSAQLLRFITEHTEVTNSKYSAQIVADESNARLCTTRHTKTGNAVSLLAALLLSTWHTACSARAATTF